MCIFCLCFWCQIQKIIAKITSRSLSPIFFLPEVLWFQVLHLSLESILSWFLSMVSDKGPVSFFCIWLSSFVNTAYWRDYFFLLCSIMVGSFFPYILFHVFIFQNSYKKYVLSQFYFISFFKDFIRCGPFLKSSLNLLQYCFCFMFYFYLVTRHEGS